ncbi:hypothetical protein [Hymenobacter daeguensis]
MPTVPLSPIFATAAGELFTHPDAYAVLRYRAGKWGVPDLEPLVARLSALLLANGWHRALVDARLLPLFSPETKAWIATHWMGGGLPRPSYLYLALLQPPEVFARLAVAELQYMAPNNTTYTYFDYEAAAHAYLKTLAR